MNYFSKILQQWLSGLKKPRTVYAVVCRLYDEVVVKATYPSLEPRVVRVPRDDRDAEVAGQLQEVLRRGCRPSKQLRANESKSPTYGSKKARPF